MDLSDPREDLEDSERWKVLFEVNDDSKALALIHGFRCQGAKLVYDQEKDMLKMEPKVGEQNWASKVDYNKKRKKYLIQNEQIRNKVIEIIKRTERELRKRGEIG